MVVAHAGPFSAHAQNPLLDLPPAVEEQETEKKPAELEEEERGSLEDWRASAQQRLKEVSARIKEAEENEDDQPTPKQRQQEELLSWLDLTLSQLGDEQEKAEQLSEYLRTEKEQLEKFVQEGLADKENSFVQLDRSQDELAAEKKRLSRVKKRVKAATEAAESARHEQKERASARRQAREAVERNSDDKKREALGDALAEAELMCEISEATAQLREQELKNAKTSQAAQQANVKMLTDKVARLKEAAKFGEEQLQQLVQELEKRENTLENKIDNAKDAENEIKILEALWLNAQQKLETAPENRDFLSAEISAYKIRSRALRERSTLLRQQLEIVSSFRDIWQQRQQIFLENATRKEAAKWKKEAKDAVDFLNSKESETLLDIDEIQSELEQVKQRLDKLSADADLRNGLVGQQAGYEQLLDGHRKQLATIREAMQLQRKLLDELDAGSITDSAKDQLMAVWNGISALWNQELTNFGTTSLTVRKVVLAVLLLLIGIMVSRWMSRFLGAQILRRIDLDPSASATIQSLFFYTLLLIFTLFSLKVVNVPLTAFTVLGGAVALGVGFGSQNVINNFISGLILHAERPVKVGDLIQLDDLYGNVEHIGARSTRVRTGSNLEIIVPNSTFLQNNVINFTLSSDKVRTSVEVGVVYGSPVVTVTQLLRRAVVETGRVSKDPPPIILFKEFGNNALLFEIHFWIRMRTVMDRLQVESAVRYRIEQLFGEEGIVIAFPQRDVHLDTVSPLKIEMIPPSQSDDTPQDTDS